MNKKILATLVALIFVLGFAGLALANDGAFADFNAQYPGKSYGCNLCHGGTPPVLNVYGAALLVQGATGSNITAAMFVAVEPFDSDGDGATNIEEINAGTLPGDPISLPPLPTWGVTAPAAGESVPTGQDYSITWTTSPGAASYKVKLSTDGGQTWSTLATGLSGTTTTTWAVPTTITKNIKKAIVKVIAYDSNNVKLGAAKSGTFSIDVLTITAPAAGAIVPESAPYTITWTANGTAAAPDQVIVKYTLNNGTTWKTAQGTLGASSFSWDVPDVTKTKTKAKVKVILKAVGKTVAKAVSGKFTVQNP